MQLRGRKRMLFWPPAAQRAFRVYPDDHALARRARVDPRAASARAARAEHALSDDELACVARGARAVTLAPGDVLFFPQGWLHDTEALAPRRRDERGERDRGLSVSMTYRVTGDGMLVG